MDGPEPGAEGGTYTGAAVAADIVRPFFPPAHTHALYALQEHFYVLLDSFEGPLDLLLFLVRKNRVAIEDLPILNITRQYLAYLELMGEMNLAIASEYLVMAATLIQIKSRVLIRMQTPTDEGAEDEGEDPREELIARLQAYELYRKGADFLAAQPLLGRDVFSRPQVDDFSRLPAAGDTAPVERYAVTVADLLTAYVAVADRLKAESERLEIVQDAVSLDQMLDHVTARLATHSPQEFEELARRLPADRSLLAVLFFSLLELTRLKRVRLAQEEPFAPIVVSRRRHSGDGPPVADGWNAAGDGANPFTA
ncbi:MAG: segregation/condensation protein A [Deltaproteobacteria bacterium]|nr:segregation/condensation protein A [Candidatus Anaeroferrophillacea bacterium]